MASYTISISPLLQYPTQSLLNFPKPPDSPQATTFLLGISDPSCAGKTTFAHLFTHIFISHVQPFPSFLSSSSLFMAMISAKPLIFLPTCDNYVDVDEPTSRRL